MSKKLCSKKNWIYAALSCLSLMISLSADLSGVTLESGAGFWELLAVNIRKLEYVLPTFSYRDAILAFLVFYFFFKTEESWNERVSRWAYRIPAGLTAFFLVFGYSFRYTNSWDLIFMDAFHMCVCAVMLAGFYVLFVRLYMLLIGKLYSCGLHWEKAGKITG